MMFKVYYQEDKKEAPVREKTKVAYIEAGSVREVRQMLKEQNYNIEYVGALTDAHLEYERQNEDFTVLEH